MLEWPVYARKDRDTAVVLCGAGAPGETWQKAVAREISPTRTLFVWREERSHRAALWGGAGIERPTHADLERAAALLGREQQVRAGDEILFRAGDEPMSIVVPTPDTVAAECRETVLTREGLDAWIKGTNEGTIPDVVRSLRSLTGVIPFIGAGASMPFGYPMWGPFLEGAAPDTHKATIANLVKAGKYEEAAGYLDKLDKKAFDEKVRVTFTQRPALADGVLEKSPLSRLPLVAPGPVITTNFDRVLECVYNEIGRGFSKGNVVFGRNDVPAVITALQQNHPALIKLHGDPDHPASMVFTDLQYGEGYGPDGTGPLFSIGSVVYTNRPLLFLGCSLETDQTLKVLEKVHEGNRYLHHYAILAAPYGASKRDARVKKLREVGIGPLWFAPGAFEDITALLDRLIHLSAVDALTAASRAPAPAPPPSPVGPAWPSFDGTRDWWPTPTDEHISSVVETLLGGRLALFLGAAVHPPQTRLLGRKFYEEICARAAIPWPSRDRADAAQHVADLDRATLSRLVNEIMSGSDGPPGPIHRLVAALPPMLRARGVPPLLVVTTNYDCALEGALEAAGEPYHLFLYHHDGIYAGRFLHRLPDGGENLIRVPAAIREPLAPGTVVVKMNGGLDPAKRWPPSFVVASRDFEELSTRMPDGLPRVLWDRLKARSLLFLGHGLREPDVRVLTRRLKRPGAAPTSWAVQLGGADQQYWREVAGIEIIDAELGVYASRLWSALSRR